MRTLGYGYESHTRFGTRLKGPAKHRLQPLVILTNGPVRHQHRPTRYPLLSLTLAAKLALPPRFPTAPTPFTPALAPALGLAVETSFRKRAVSTPSQIGVRVCA